LADAVAADALLSLRLSAPGDDPSLALVYTLTRKGVPCWALWAYVAIAAAGFAAMLPTSAAFVGTSMATFSRPMLFQGF
jgi:hypothetical protein